MFFGGEAAAIHKADPAARRKLLLLAAAGGILLLGLGGWFQHYLNTLPVESGAQMVASTHAVIDTLIGSLYGGALLLGLLAVYWWQQGRIIAAAPQYPLPQMRLFHDMRILRGEAKRKRALRARYAAIAVLILAGLSLGAAATLPRRMARAHPLLFRPNSVPIQGAAGHAP